MTFLQIFAGVALLTVSVGASLYVIFGALFMSIKWIDEYLPDWCAVVYIAALIIAVPSAILYFVQ